jgi:hypothetical protein
VTHAPLHAIEVDHTLRSPSHGCIRAELLVDSPWCDAEPGRTGSGVKTLVPDRDDQIGVPDGESAREMHGIGTPEGVTLGEFARLPLHDRGELDPTRRGPELLPRPLGGLKLTVVEDVVAGGRSERGAYFGVGEPTRDGGVAAVPKLSSQIAADLFHHKLHEGARVEIDQRHASAPLLADEVGYRPARAGSRAPGRGGSLYPLGSSDDALVL